MSQQPPSQNNVMIENKLPLPQSTLCDLLVTPISPQPPPMKPKLPEVVKIKKPRLVAELTNAAAEADDTSPIRWVAKVWLNHGFGKMHSARVLVDIGAHGDFISEQFAARLGVQKLPLEEGSAAQLPNGKLIPMLFQTAPLTLSIDRAYKADLQFKTLPLNNYDIILGSTWLHANKVVANFETKVCTFPHRRHTVTIQPANPPKKLQLDRDSLWKLVQDKQKVSSVAPKKHVRLNLSQGPRQKWPHRLKTLRQSVQAERRRRRQDILETAASTGEHQRDLKDYEVEGVELQSRKTFLRATKKRDCQDLSLLLLRRREDGTLEVAKGKNLSKFSSLDLSSLEMDLLQDIDVSIVKNHPETLPKITELFRKHQALLDDTGELAFPKQDEVQHTIEEIPGSRPVGRPVYRLSQPQMVELQKQLAKLLDAGLISPSSSPYAAPILFAPKKDGGLRMCTDY